MSERLTKEEKKILRAPDLEVSAVHELVRFYEITGVKTPFPTANLLRELADAVDILLGHHNYDGHGHEGIRYAQIEARKRADEIEVAYRKAEGI